MSTTRSTPLCFAAALGGEALPGMAFERRTGGGRRRATAGARSATSAGSAGRAGGRSPPAYGWSA
jgi:hypothetical protein